MKAAWSCRRCGRLVPPSRFYFRCDDRGCPMPMAWRSGYRLPTSPDEWYPWRTAPNRSLWHWVGRLLGIIPKAPVYPRELVD